MKQHETTDFTRGLHLLPSFSKASELTSPPPTGGVRGGHLFPEGYLLPSFFSSRHHPFPSSPEEGRSYSTLQELLRPPRVTPPSKSYSTLQELLLPSRVTPPSKSYSTLQELLLPSRVTPPSKSYSVVRRRCFGVVISLPSFSKGGAGVVCKKTVPTSFLLPPFSLSSSRVKPFCINSCRCCVAH